MGGGLGGMTKFSVGSQIQFYNRKMPMLSGKTGKTRIKSIV